MTIWSNERYVRWTPAAARVAFEIANIGFILRMIQTHSSRDQSVFSWCLLFVALCAWANFYRVCTPEQRIARIASIVAALTNLAVLITVLYFKVF